MSLERTQAGYQYLFSYKITVPIYDLTVEFCRRCGRGFPHLSSPRTYDQMIQAARSGMQNVAEGYKEKSLSNYIKLVGIARGSLEELLNDFLSYARQNRIPVWEKERVRREIRESEEIWKILAKTPSLPPLPFFPTLPKNPETAVNLLIDLLKQAGYLQDRLVSSLKDKFVKEGGFSENLLKERLEYRKRNPRQLLALFIIILPFAFLLLRHARAVNMSSDSYQIQWANVNIGSGRYDPSASYNLEYTMGELTPGRFESTGYLIRSGFQYIHSIIPFSFKISDLDIAFGSLVPEQFSTATHNLTVSAGGAGGYQVLAAENHVLRSTQGGEIANTQCDSGPCTSSDARVWTQANSSSGFGYNMSSTTNNIDKTDFVDSTYFRPFANQELSQAAQVVMSSASATLTATATVTFKVNVQTLQQAGSYENMVTYTAIPIY